jgi:UDP-N-acetylmuramate dehydrogenase
LLESAAVTLREHEPLSRHTTLRVGGPARFFVEATSDAEVREAVQLSWTRRLPVFVLGGGSNVLIADHGFPGLVIKMATRGIHTRPISPQAVEIISQAGEDWDSLVRFTVERALFGLENLSLIPGTAGAAVRGNIGAYGAEIKDSFLWAEAQDLRTGVLQRFSAQDCGFAYRSSFFQSPEGRHFLVLRAAFCLRQDGRLNLSYRDVSDCFSAPGAPVPSLAAVRDAIIGIRRNKLPDCSSLGTAGSFFKNPILSRAAFDALARRYPGLPGHEEPGQRVKVPLGWILDKVCGLRGFRRGPVGTFSKQALVLINEGGTAADVEALADEIACRVRAATGLDPEWEVERVPGPLVGSSTGPLNGDGPPATN